MFCQLSLKSISSKDTSDIVHVLSYHKLIEKLCDN